MSLALLHAGFSAPGFSPTLDLNFASTLSLTPTSGPTPSFSRASSGTYFGSDGLLKYAQLNLALYSEQFNDAYWTKARAVITANAIAAPDNKVTAEKIAGGSGETIVPTAYRSITVTSGLTYTISIYAKAGEWSFLDLGTSGAIGGGGTDTFFNLSNGTIGTSGHASAAISDAGNGWYRCSVTGTAASASLIVYFNAAQANNSFAVSGNGTSGLYIWGAQVENGSSAGLYAKTEASTSSAPRFDHTYNGSAWVSKGLLVEEQRTNLLTYSNTFSNGAWTLVRGTVTQSITSPDGTSNAWQADCNATGGGHYAYITPSGASTSGFYTISVFAKKGNNGIINLQLADTSFANYVNQFFDLTNGTTTGSATIVGNYSSVSAAITNVGNGWYRCSLTANKGSGNGITASVGFSNNDTGGFCTSGQYNCFFNAQLEFGAFATSTLVTTSSQVTRSADVCQITGTDFSSFYNATEGTVVADYTILSSAGVAGSLLRFADAVPGNQSWEIGTRLASNIYYAECYNQTSGGYQAQLSSAFTGSLSAKIAFAVKANDFAASFNGGSAVTDTSGVMPVGVANLYFYPGNSYLNGHIARLRYYPLRLPNATLEDLCSPESQLKLDLQFATNKSLTPVAGPTPSYSRASTGTYFNASGVLTSAALNGPRFDHVYNGTSWVSRGLIIEEQRTNYSKYGNDLSTNWIDSTATRDYNSIASPDGNTNATKVNVTANLYSGIYQFPQANGGSGTYTYSIFAKKGTKDWLWILNASGTVNTGTFFNLSNGTIGTIYTGHSATITNVGGGWYRCTVTTPASTTPTWFQLGFSDSNNSYAPASTGYSYVYGAQLELGSFSTSYISNNTGSSVTRSADVCQITGSDFSGIYNQSEGSLIADYDFIASPSNRVSPRIWCISDGAYTNSIFLQSGTNDNLVVYQGGAIQADIYSAAVSALVSRKSSSAYRSNDFALCFDGGSILPDTSGNVPAVNRLEVGFASDISGRILNGHISRLRYYAIRLPDRLLIAKSQ